MNQSFLSLSLSKWNNYFFHFSLENGSSIFFRFFLLKPFSFLSRQHSYILVQCCCRRLHSPDNKILDMQRNNHNGTICSHRPIRDMSGACINFESPLGGQFDHQRVFCLYTIDYSLHQTTLECCVIHLRVHDVEDHVTGALYQLEIKLEPLTLGISVPFVKRKQGGLNFTEK